MSKNTIIVTTRAIVGRLVPSGNKVNIPKDSFVRLTQALGGTYTIDHSGNLYRIDAKDADALGQTPYEITFSESNSKEVKPEHIDQALRSIYDPEIAVNIVDLGLIYNTKIKQNHVKIIMTLTAPGCGMGEVLMSDIKDRLSQAPNVESVEVELVFDPPWDRTKISDEAKLELGLL